MTNEEIIKQIHTGADQQQLMLLLWQQNEGITTKICRKYSSADEVDDLLQEAFFALHAAVEHFEPAAGVRFTSYYTAILERHLQRYLDSNGKNIVPARVRYRFKQYEEYCAAFREEYGRFPERRDFLEDTDFTQKELEAFARGGYCSAAVSLDASVKGKDGGEDMPLSEAVPDGMDIESDIIEQSYQKQLKRDLWEALQLW